jgi:hypothetical protein
MVVMLLGGCVVQHSVILPRKAVRLLGQPRASQGHMHLVHPFHLATVKFGAAFDLSHWICENFCYLLHS